MLKQLDIVTEKWICPLCTFENSKHYYRCEMCNLEDEKFHIRYLNEEYKEENKFQKLHNYFNKITNILLPVVSCFNEEQFEYNIDILYEYYVQKKIDGIIIINTNCSLDILFNTLNIMKNKYPDLWIGINILGYNIFEVLNYLTEITMVNGLWIDNSYVTDKDYQNIPEIIINHFKNISWDGLYFGGTLFKYIKYSGDTNKICSNSIPYMDIITTSGDGTGIPIEINKLQNIYNIIDNKRPIALASGITSDNIDIIKEYVDIFIVGTYIVDDNYNININNLNLLINKL